ncbi:MAG: phosphoheptose isomerase [Hymenobacter sp.]|nr:MAG: phosphoheptose isomerase [Hymenobacter sp.]
MPLNDAKSDLFAQVAAQLHQQELVIVQQDQTRPWGGFFVLEKSQAQQFADLYFDGLAVDSLRIAGQLSPKVLLVAPQQRLSWQYHHRRAEIWQVVQSPVGVATSDTDAESKARRYEAGERLVLRQGKRHHLVGLESWGIVAKVWQHTDPAHPSDESDIVRVQDDFGR